MSSMQVLRSIKIDAPVAKVYQSISDFKNWPKWSPWLITEPDCKVAYSDDGKSYSWAGNYVGSGEMAVTKQVENQSIDYHLEFLKPWKSTAEVSMDLKSDGDGTQVTWSMNSSVPFFMFFIKNMMEGLIGMDYERGLAMLKDLLETGSVPVKLAFGEVTIGPMTIVGRRSDCATVDISKSMGNDVEKLQKWCETTKPCVAGKMLSVYHEWNPSKGLASYTIGLPMKELPDEIPEGFVTMVIPEVDAFTSQLTGPYKHLGNAWAAGISRARSKLFKQSRKVKPFEIYENEPGTVDDNDLITTVYFPKK